jgi:PAP2 superfamily
MVTSIRMRSRMRRFATGVLFLSMVPLGTGHAAANEVAEWNEIAFKVLLDGGQNNVTLTRGITMVSLAIHDALNAINRRYEAYVFDGPPESNAVPEAAIATAARDALVLAVPAFGTASQQATAIAMAEAAYGVALAKVPDGPGKTSVVAVGRAAAAAIVSLRKDDGATREAPYTPGSAPGQWRPHPNPVPADPPVPSPALAPGYAASMLPGWGSMTPFTLLSGTQFRLAGPPPLTSEAYARDFNEVKSIGSKGSTARTPEQSQIARYWYEGSAQGWNRIARVVASAKNLDRWELARLLALANMAMADGFIAGWNVRYHYNFWRPVTAIRLADSDGNPATAPDPSWETFLNTPPIPDYPSTHSVLGGAAAVVLAEVFGADRITFTMVSGPPFAGISRSFTSFSGAAQENADSRVYAGIHFRTACRDGVALGQKIGQRVARMYLLPVRR